MHFSAFCGNAKGPPKTIILDFESTKSASNRAQNTANKLSVVLFFFVLEYNDVGFLGANYSQTEKETN